MRTLPRARVASLLCSFALAPSVLATPLREVAPSLIAAAPDQDTLHELLSPAPSDDAEDRQEEEAERLARASALEKVYKILPSELQRAEAIHELSTLLHERALDLKAEAVRAYRLEHDRWWIGETLTEPNLRLGPVRDQLLKLVNLQREMVANFERHPRLAQASWQLATTMARLGNEHAERYFKQAILQAKAPEWAIKANLSRADWLVAGGKLDEALRLYTQVRETPKVPAELKAYATYRLAWTHLAKGWSAPAAERRAHLDKAAVALKLVVMTTDEDDEPRRFPLHQEAASDLAWLWALDDTKEKEALAFFDKQDLPEMALVFREKQAQERLRRGQLPKAVAYLRARIAEDPEDPRRPDLHLKLAHAFIAAGDATGLREETKALARITSDEDDDWFDEYEDDETLMPRAKRMHALLPMAAGFRLFRAAAAEQDPKRRAAMLAVSMQELQAAVAAAKNPEQALEIRVTLVQGLIVLSRFAEALDHLDAIVKLGAKAGSHLAGAAQERLNILAKLDELEKYPPLPPPGDVPKPLPLPKIKQRFAAAAEEFLRIAPDSEIKPNLHYQIAIDLFAYGHYDVALRRFERLAHEFPRTPQARAGIELCLSMNLKRQNWDELIRLSTDFLNNRNVKGNELRNYIKENLDWAKVQKSGGGPLVH